MKKLSIIITAVMLALVIAATLPAQVFAASVPEYISEVKIGMGKKPRQNCSVGGYCFLCNCVREVVRAFISRPFQQPGVQNKKNPNCIIIRVLLWLRREDLNLRPPGYERLKSLTI